MPINKPMGPVEPATSDGQVLVWNSQKSPPVEWADAPGGGGPHAIGGLAHNADTIANIRTKCSDATIETTAGSAAAAYAGGTTGSVPFALLDSVA